MQKERMQFERDNILSILLAAIYEQFDFRFVRELLSMYGLSADSSAFTCKTAFNRGTQCCIMGRYVVLEEQLRYNV